MPRIVSFPLKWLKIEAWRASPWIIFLYQGETCRLACVKLGLYSATIVRIQINHNV